MVSKKQMLKVLEERDLEAIHGAALQVLTRTGVLINSDETLSLLERKKGLIVDRKSRIVKMPEPVVMEAVKSCKKNFKFHARSEKNTFDVVDGTTKIGPGAECVYYIDPDTGRAANATLEDGIKCCRLLDALDNIKIAYVPTHISDVPDNARRIVSMITGLVHSSKCTYGGSVDKSDVELAMRLGEAFYGDREELRKRPLFCGYVDPISPLSHEHTMLETLLGYSAMDMPVFVTVMALAGGTAPAAFAGLLVQQNAEVLSSIVIASCVTKNPRIIYGSVSCPLDMRTGMAATGAPEFSMIGVAAVQLAKFYGLPSNMGVQTDSKLPDAQAAHEKAFSALAAAAAGADFSDLFYGAIEAFNTYSPVQLIIDDEIASNALRFAQGIEVNDETLSVDLINEVGPMGNFLKKKDTMVRFKKEHLQPTLADRWTRTKWMAMGAKDENTRAKERLKAILATHEPEPLEPEVRNNLDALLREYTRSWGLERLEKRCW